MSKAKRNIMPIKAVKNENISIIIPAAGIGKRMKLGGAKSLIDINQYENIINRQLRILKKRFTNAEYVLVVGFEADKVIKNTPNEIIKVENERYETTNVVRSINIGLNACTKNNVLIVYGDLIFDENILDSFVPSSSQVFVTSFSCEANNEEVGCTYSNKNMRLENIYWDLPNKWSQIIYLQGYELELFKKLASNRDNEKLYGFELINFIIDRGGRFDIFASKSICFDIDCNKDLLFARKILNEDSILSKSI